jgi:predicted SnoaL-like aldol condensation-catalyzing enzyme
MAVEQNKQRARLFVDEMMSGHHVERIDEFVAPDAINHERGHVVNYREALRSVFGVSESAWEFAIEDIIADGDRVVVRCTATYSAVVDRMPRWGVPYRKGARATVEHVHIFRFRDGMIVEHWPVRDDLHAMMQWNEAIGSAPAERLIP